MIIGHGLIAKGFAKRAEYENGVIVFASGVSNSGETAINAFAREAECLTQAMAKSIGVFVYFSTCSVRDHERLNTPYVQHKIQMENLVRTLPQYLIFRLSQVVGHTPNPHTLTNYIHAQLSLSRRFPLWKNAWRNIIDIDDVVAIADYMIRDKHALFMNQTINIANPSAISALNLVEIFECVMKTKAHYDLIDRGDHYAIDVETALDAANKLGIEFGTDYEKKVIEKYYGRENAQT
jgi:nucleoside-diphosphate-sugar epimerase